MFGCYFTKMLPELAMWKVTEVYLLATSGNGSTFKTQVVPFSIDLSVLW